MIRPVFHQDELFGFVANVGHLAEIGGKAVGSFAADATEVFQEGLPPRRSRSSAATRTRWTCGG